MEKDTDKEFTYMQIEINIMESFLMINNKAKEF